MKLFIKIVIKYNRYYSNRRLKRYLKKKRPKKLTNSKVNHWSISVWDLVDLAQWWRGRSRKMRGQSRGRGGYRLQILLMATTAYYRLRNNHTTVHQDTCSPVLSNCRECFAKPSDAWNACAPLLVTWMVRSTWHRIPTPFCVSMCLVTIHYAYSIRWHEI